MKYVIGIDLGTSAVKILLVNEYGSVVQEVSRPYSLIQKRTGYSEQNPLEWFNKTIEGLTDLIKNFKGDSSQIEGISFSGQMHGLVLLDENNEVLRNAILWNDTRTTKECQEIYKTVGKERLLDITKNIALEGFTLPKILWVRKNEPDIFSKAKKFLLPKDYLRYKLTGKLHMDYSDAAGTLLFDVKKKKWSKEICDLLKLDYDFCPPIIESHKEVGKISSDLAEITGLSNSTRIFAGGADNACGAIGSGVIESGRTMVSIGTSGVVLSYEENADKDFEGKVHYFNHGVEDAFYTMGVTLSAGYSLSWFKDVFAEDQSFEKLLKEIKSVPIGSNGLLFTPYLMGERTPHVDANIRGSFIGINSTHQKKDFVRAIIEGITFSLNESIDIFRKNGKTIDTIISIGGGSKNDDWMQIQADIFNAKIIKLSSQQGPGIGAAMLAAYGCGWFDTLKDCSDSFLQVDKEFIPKDKNVNRYKKLFHIYQSIYKQTKELNNWLIPYRG